MANETLNPKTRQELLDRIFKTARRVLYYSPYLEKEHPTQIQRIFENTHNPSGHFAEEIFATSDIIYPNYEWRRSKCERVVRGLHGLKVKGIGLNSPSRKEALPYFPRGGGISLPFLHTQLETEKGIEDFVGAYVYLGNINVDRNGNPEFAVSYPDLYFARTVVGNPFFVCGFGDSYRGPSPGGAAFFTSRCSLNEFKDYKNRSSKGKVEEEIETGIKGLIRAIKKYSAIINSEAFQNSKEFLQSFEGFFRQIQEGHTKESVNFWIKIASQHLRS